MTFLFIFAFLQPKAEQATVTKIFNMQMQLFDFQKIP